MTPLSGRNGHGRTRCFPHSGRECAMTHDYKRHGTTTLFAALNILDGTVIGRNMQHHRHQALISRFSATIISFPAANRDPAIFPDADRVIIDRAQNRHAAFGLGIHRCVGSNLARMEIRIALTEWLAHFPEFVLTQIKW